MSCRVFIPKNNKIIILDINDYLNILVNKKYHFKESKNTSYVKVGRNYLHRIIMGSKKGDIINHIDGNGLNNSRKNLRICSRHENMRNRHNHKFRFKGVFKRKNLPTFRSYISYNGKQIYVGSFENEIDAAEAYNLKAIELFGEFAKLNDIS
jgi:acid phosphatase class B